ncbi:patatin-like phospholipase family protein [Microbacterium sp. NPDC090281]|uniref:patatin-like phospholipase family protein n=1 Tax=Microbacterium sp. NPDC090281 TaxID=3364208 RepID=UPI00381A0530
MNNTFSPSSSTNEGNTTQRALVLGGGGSAGNAWLIGVVAGLADARLDANAADLIVGTSAGATAAAQITGTSPAQLFHDVISSAVSPHATPSGRATARGQSGSAAAHLERTQRIIDASRDVEDMRRRMGAAAIELATTSAGAGQRWRETVAARLPRPEWPEQRILITAVDASTGEPVVFDRFSGVALVDAVAASCASGFAYDVGASRYIDGGYRANAENADLALGYRKVLIFAPFGGASRMPVTWGTHLSAQIDRLRSQGSSVRTIFPDDESRGAFGENVMDPSTRVPTAQAGFRQGRAAAVALTDFWE